MISKKKFIDAWNKFPPRKLEKWFYAHFSKNSNHKLGNYITATLLILFLMGFIGTVVNFNKQFIGSVSICFLILLLLIAILWFTVHFIHTKRLNKIAKELGITKKEYTETAEKWGEYIK